MGVAAMVIRRIILVLVLFMLAIVGVDTAHAQHSELSQSDFEEWNLVFEMPDDSEQSLPLHVAFLENEIRVMRFDLDPPVHFPFEEEGGAFYMDMNLGHAEIECALESSGENAFRGVCSGPNMDVNVRFEPATPEPSE